MTVGDTIARIEGEAALTWYHGTPLQLCVLREGSTITQDRHLAEVFSHKPEIVSVNGDGSIKHTGTLPGYLYCIDEQVEDGDIYPHPNSAMSPGKEWLTTRALRLRLIGPVEIAEEERLTEKELAGLRQLMQGGC